MDLTDASAIVTGGAGGLGAATVRRLAQMGAKVVIVDVSDERVAAERCDGLVATGVMPGGVWL
jgi:NAD(P)-dependent dehydrogenase (short-subunit alcohol dehydrogenase family)